MLTLLCVQGLTGVPKNAKLSGVTPLKQIPTDLPAAWVDGQFQSAVSFNVDKTFGFRAPIVRLLNELRYWLFSEFNPQIVQGEDGYLFETAYRESICGFDFLGEEIIQEKVDSLEMLRLQLERQGKKLLLVIPPNKWRALKDKVDWECRHHKHTNYHVFCQKLYDKGFYLFDHMDYFSWEMESSPYPLFSKQGTHWSIYGAAISSLSVIASFRSEGIDIPSVSIDSIELGEPRNTDKDLYDLLNLMSRPNKEDRMLAYPHLSFEGEEKPRVLVIGDSYYWSYYYLGLHEGLFHPESKFFYYNASMVGQDVNDRTLVTSQIRNDEIESSDVVLLVMSEPSLKDFGFGILGQQLR